MLKKQIAMFLGLALILASVPLTAISADSSENSLDYLLGDVIYENDFQTENGGGTSRGLVCRISVRYG